MTQYAVILVSDPQVGNDKRQTVYADLGSGNIRIWQRITDGGRGLRNAWEERTSLNPADIDAEPILGPVISVPLAETDIDFISSAGQSNNLFLKLLRTWEAGLQLGETSTYENAFIAHQDIVLKGVDSNDSWKTFHVDRRKVRPTVLTPTQPTEVTPVIAPTIEPTPVVPVVRVVEPSAPAPVSALWYPDFSDERVSSYIPRVVHGVGEEVFYDFARANQYPVKLEGPAGTGKTSSSTWYAAKRGLPMLKLTGSTATDATDILGSIRPDKETGTFRWHDGLLTSACRVPSVILLNEVNLLPARMANLVMSALEERHFTLTGNNNEVVQVHPDTLIVADMNPNYRGTTPLNEALNDRFAVSLTFNYDEEIERKIIPSASLLDLAQDLRNQALEGKYNAPVSTRALKTFCSIAKGLSLDFAIETFISKFPAGEERASLRLLFETYRWNIASDLGVDAETTVNN